MENKTSQIQVGVKASLIVEKETAMAALALVRLYCKATGSEMVRDKDEKGEVTYCLMGPENQEQDIGRGMTNFEKFKESISMDDAAEYFSTCFEGKCDACPALEKCRLVEDGEEISCIDVFRNWLKEEADV